jgi:hypothetical protein
MGKPAIREVLTEACAAITIAALCELSAIALVGATGFVWVVLFQ